MAKIHVLDKAVAELIAAGEVVERPASIVKELVENAIDAGASSVSVEIEGGGIKLIRVRDNGCGIAREDVPAAFLRHATSKVSGAADLEAITTLGFRGEALASIAAMSRVELITKTAGEQQGTRCAVEGGELLEIEEAGCPTGTTITVRDVFYNTPARMKFLKKDVSEGTAVAQVVDKCAMSHPEIAFRFSRDGQSKLQTTGGGELLSVIRAIYGRDLAAGMHAVDYLSDEGVRVSGYVTDPAAAKPSRTYQNFFLNARYVRTRTAMAAVEEACRTLVPGGRFPGCVLNIELPAQLVDVNVHPAKLEVRFAQEKPVYSAVYIAVKSALGKTDRPGAQQQEEPVVRLSEQAPEPPKRMSAQEFRVLFTREDDESEQQGAFARPLSFHASNVVGPDIYVSERDADAPPVEKATPVVDAIFPKSARNDEKKETYSIEEEPTEPIQVAFGGQQTLRLIGELFGTYILLERGDTMILVDKHAAHERMLYEQIKQTVESGDRQVLLEPVRLTLAREEHAALMDNTQALLDIGFLVEDFGGSSVVVREVPSELGEQDLGYLLSEIADRLRAGSRDLTPTVLERLYFSIACKSAVRARDKNTAPELAAIVRRLEQNPEITHCPHGRPVRVEFSRQELEKRFGRIL